MLGLACLLLCITGTFADTTVTIYNEFLAQGGRVNYESKRWNKHNGLDRSNLVSHCKSIGTAAGRWMNRDLNDHFFQDWPQNPNNHGYPDPKYMWDNSRSHKIYDYYMENVHAYGSDMNMVWVIKSLYWPKWMDTSHHKGMLPNNFDAASEMVALMVGGLKDYAKGHLPEYFEVINEPEAHWQVFDSTTLINYHKAVAQKLKSRFGIKVGGPTYTGYVVRTDDKNFRLWNGARQFLDFSLDHLDFFSFHSYNDVTVHGNSHTFSGINEARLIAYMDMIENYAHIKKGRKVPLIISEYGRGAVNGISQDAHSDIVDFATIYHANAHRFTYLGMREFMEDAVLFLLANEQYPGHNSLNWSLFTKEGQETHLTMVYKFWHHLTTSHKFLKFTSDFSGWERQVSPQVLANPTNKELVVLLHNYGTQWQNVHLDFHKGWMNPTSGQSTCIFYQNGKPVMHSNVHFDTTKNHGKVGLPGEGTCMYIFNTNYNFNSLRTTNENTYYGSDMVIPISNGHVKTTIHLPSSGYHTAHLRVGVSRSKSSNAKPTSITVNGHNLPSTYMLYDSDKNNADTKWELWEYWVPEGQLHSTNTISMNFAGSGGHVSSVALVVGKLQ